MMGLQKSWRTEPEHFKEQIEEFFFSKKRRGLDPAVKARDRMHTSI